MQAVREFLQQHAAMMLLRSREHLTLTVLAMVVAVALAVPLGVFLSRCRQSWVVSGVMGVVNVIQPIPSLATVALTVVVFFYIIDFTGTTLLRSIGMQPALVALVAYALLPILRNTYTGLRQVDAAVIEVAVGMGMTRRQILFSVQLPLALPFIMAGIRISTVWTIGVATLVSLVGAGGLGDPIFRGLANYRMDLVLAGALPAALLALLLDTLLARLEQWLTPEGLRDGQSD